MKAAVTYEDGNIFQHFGRTEQFKLYDVEDGAIVSEEILDTNTERWQGFSEKPEWRCWSAGGLAWGHRMPCRVRGFVCILVSAALRTRQ